MEDKVFDLLEKMYTELKDFKNDTVERFEKIDQRFDNLENKVTKIEISLENDIKPNVKLALQGLIDINEKLTNVESEVSKHEEIILRRIK